MRVAALLICQRHQAGENRARETGAADPVLIVVDAVGEGLRLPDQQPCLRVRQSGNVRHSAPRQVEACHPLIIRFGELATYSAACASLPASPRTGERAGITAVRAHPPAGLNGARVMRIDSEAGAADCGYPGARSRPFCGGETEVHRFVPGIT